MCYSEPVNKRLDKLAHGYIKQIRSTTKQVKRVYWQGRDGRSHRRCSRLSIVNTIPDSSTAMHRCKKLIVMQSRARAALLQLIHDCTIGDCFQHKRLLLPIDDVFHCCEGSQSKRQFVQTARTASLRFS